MRSKIIRLDSRALLETVIDIELINILSLVFPFLKELHQALDCMNMLSTISCTAIIFFCSVLVVKFFHELILITFTVHNALLSKVLMVLAHSAK